MQAFELPAFGHIAVQFDHPPGGGALHLRRAEPGFLEALPHKGLPRGLPPRDAPANQVVELAGVSGFGG